MEWPQNDRIMAGQNHEMHSLQHMILSRHDSVSFFGARVVLQRLFITMETADLQVLDRNRDSHLADYGSVSCPWEQPAGITLHDGLKLLDVERRLNQF